MSQVNYYRKRAIAHLCPAPLCHRSHNPIGKNDKELNPGDVEGPNITAQKKEDDLETCHTETLEKQYRQFDIGDRHLRDTTFKTT